MAANRFATNLHRNTHETIFILVYAVLEWILILMLLLNSLFSYSIRKFASYFGLKPPCVWCSTVDHLLEPNKNINPYRNLICEPHLTEISNLHSCSDHQKLTDEARFVGSDCFSCMSLYDEEDSVQISYPENENVQVLNLPDENKSQYIQDFDRIIPLEWTDSSTSGSTSSSLFGEEIVVVKDENQAEKQGSMKAEEDKKQGSEECNDEALTVESLKAEVKAERLALYALYIELEEERNASAIAANQTMAMITRLQEEKAALQIEAMQNQRMMEEQAEYDQEALQLLNELVIKKENEKLELENELEIFKKEKVKLMRENASASCSESIDKTEVLELEESMVEFEDERRSILNEIKDLEEKLFVLADGLNEDAEGTKGLEEKRRISVFDIEYKGGVEEDYESLFTWSRNSYERLQAVDVDREFRTRCASLMKKEGNEGVEMLQDLEDVRSVEL